MVFVFLVNLFNLDTVERLVYLNGDVQPRDGSGRIYLERCRSYLYLVWIAFLSLTFQLF